MFSLGKFTLFGLKSDNCAEKKQYTHRLSVRSKAVVLLLLTFCALLLPLLESGIVLCSVVRYFMAILVLHSS